VCFTPTPAPQKCPFHPVLQQVDLAVVIATQALLTSCEDGAGRAACVAMRLKKASVGCQNTSSS
jgi:hypothetical protein